MSDSVIGPGLQDQHVIEGDYSAVLEQDADGDWKVKRFMALPSTPPPSSSSTH